ncbi:hypothetical protein CEXT_425811 [Caerostris extrusa]|uniref:Secreted protein n=1 Tax=Caerostris extrusa TaxID=172846 RepID=A0AAV4QZF2_CAEEX|nr:hypothetical protein CEXT_425811 [Caerostris extrusa]
MFLNTALLKCGAMLLILPICSRFSVAKYPPTEDATLHSQDCKKEYKYLPEFLSTVKFADICTTLRKIQNPLLRQTNNSQACRQNVCEPFILNVFG